jgi:histidinol dehydrogenase
MLIVADVHADPFTIAMNLISQAKPGPDSPAVLITTSASIGRETIRHVTRLLEHSDHSIVDIAGTSWKTFGEVIVVSNLRSCG